LSIIRGKGDWWWSGALQQGYNWLKSNKVNLFDLVLIINDDVIIDKDFLEIGRSLLVTQTCCFLSAQIYSKDTDRLISAGIHVDWSNSSFLQASSPDAINCLSTRGLFLRVTDFFKVGGFYPKLLPHYLSDLEFTIRAYRKGMRLISDTSLRLWIDETSEISKDYSSASLIELFSKKSPHNPLYWTSFVFLACPLKWKIINFIRIWKRAIGRLFGMDFNLY
jgi:GT2 family glycosyltransferase